MLSSLKLLITKKLKMILILLFALIISTLIILSFGKKIKSNNPDQNNIQGVSDSQNIPPQNSPTANPQPKFTPILPTQTSQPSPTSQPLQNQETTNYTTPSFTASKTDFSPTFSLSLDSYQPSVASNVNLDFGSTSGDWYGLGFKILVPSGWEIAKGSALAQNTLVGEGTASGTENGQEILINFTLHNQSDTARHKSRWLIKFTNKKWQEKVFFVDGNKDTGHFLIFDGPVPLSLSSPVSVKIKIISNVISNPPSSGVFEWKIEYLFADGSLESKKDIEIK